MYLSVLAKGLIKKILSTVKEIELRFNKLNSSRKYLYLLWVLVVVISLAGYFPMIFQGKYHFVTADSWWTYLSSYEFFSNMLHSGNFSFWSFELEAGATIFDILGRVDPFNFILLLLGDDYIYKGMIYINIMKLLVASTGVYLYLKQFIKQEDIKIIAALIYAFSGFSLLRGQHYHFMTFIAFTPFIFILIDAAIINTKHKLLLPLLVAYLMGFQLIPFIRLGVFLPVYFVIRSYTVYKFKKRDILKSLFRCISFFLIGALFASFLLIPTIYYFSVSPRLGDGFAWENIYSIYNFKELLIIIARSFSNEFFGAGSEFNSIMGNQYATPITYNSILIMFISLLTIIYTKKRKSLLFLLSLVSTPYIFMIIDYVANIFSEVRYFRWVNIINFFFIIIIGYFYSKVDWENTKNSRKTALIIGLLLASTSISLYLFFGNQASYKAQLVILTFILIYTFLFSFKGAKIGKVLVIILLVELSAATYITTFVNRYDSSSLLGIGKGYEDGSIEAISDLESEEQLYRIEKRYNSILWNDSAYQGYYGVKGYSGLIEPFYKEFIDYFEVKTRSVNFAEGFYLDPIVESLLGIKYYLHKDNLMQFDPSWYSEVEDSNEQDDISVFKNNYYNGFGFIDNKLISYDDTEELTPSEKSIVLTQGIIVDKDKSNYEIEEFKPNQNCIVDIGSKDLEINPKNDVLTITLENLSLDRECLKEEFYSLNFEFIADSPGRLVIFLVYGDSTYKLNEGFYGDQEHSEFTIANIENLTEIRFVPINKSEYILKDLALEPFEKPSKQIITQFNDLYKGDELDVKLISQSNIEIKIGSDIEDDNVLFLPIPYDVGWKAESEGEELDVIKANIGFMGIILKENSTNINFVYSPYGFKQGTYISIGSTLLYLVYMGYNIKQWKENND